MDKMKELKKTMHRNLRESYRGWWIWHRIVRRYHLGRTRVILLPSCNAGYNYSALRYVDQMLDRHSFENAIFLTVDPLIKEVAPLFSKCILNVETVTRKQAERLMQFYCLYDFDPRFIVASLEEPNGRNAVGLIGKNGTTVEELIAIGVYQLGEFKKEKRPDYSGTNPEILDFLKAGEV